MIQTLAETGSTNADLLARLRAGELVREGDWLITDRQTAGKGRQGRKWFDGAGNFMGSTIVRLSDRDPAPSTLALVAGLALYEAVIPLLDVAGIARLKWPNDLLLDGAKLAGILLEREGDAVVIGIGVNLVRAPQLPDRKTVSLSNLNIAADRDQFAEALATSLDTEVERWRTYGLEAVIRRWEAAAHARGTALAVHEPGGTTITGRFAGLAPDGSLQLRLADGATRAIHAGDVLLA